MRLYIKISKSNKVIPFNYQELLTGCLHKWLGADNQQHGKVSLYSFSWFKNVRTTKQGIWFTNDTYMFLSFYEQELAKKVVNGILASPDVFCGSAVFDVMLQETPEFSNNSKFLAASPIFIKRTIEEEKERHYTFRDKESDLLMTETLKTKLKKADLDDSDVAVRFDKGYPNPKTKLIRYGKIDNKVNLCPVIIEGSKEQVAFAWNVGIGNSTGIGFGALK